MKPRRSYSSFGMILPAFFSPPIMEITSIFLTFEESWHSFPSACLLSFIPSFSRLTVFDIHSFIQSIYCLYYSFLHTAHFLPLASMPSFSLPDAIGIHFFIQSIHCLLLFILFFSQLIALWFSIQPFFHATYAFDIYFLIQSTCFFGTGIRYIIQSSYLHCIH
jgi:hypothetical protein